jgi:predicted acetyltransferase
VRVEDLRPIDADGDEAAWRLSAVTFGYTDEARPEDYHFTAPGRTTWGLYDSGRLIAKLTDREQSHWFGGRLVPASGVAGVAVAPEMRNRGVARRLLTHLLHETRERGAAISTLFPTTLTPYRRLGWEEVGALTSTAWPTTAVATATRSPELSVREATDEDLPLLSSVYREAAEQSTGLMDRSGPARPLADYHGVTVAVDAAGTVVGYAAWKRGSGYEANGTITVEDLFGTSAAAVSSLLWTIGGWASVAPTAILRLPPDHPAPLLFPSTGGTLHGRHPWMLRIVDAAAALAARGYPPVLDGVIDLSLVDPEGPWNAGHFRLVLANGTGRLEPGGSGRVRMTPRGLAAWYAGIAPSTLRRAGLIDGDDPLLAPAMAGPPPTLLDYF